MLKKSPDILKNGTDVNIKDIYGQTALFYSISIKNEDEEFSESIVW